MMQCKGIRLSIFLKYYLDKNVDSQLSIEKIILVKVWALVACRGFLTFPVAYRQKGISVPYANRYVNSKASQLDVLKY